MARPVQLGWVISLMALVAPVARGDGPADVVRLDAGGDAWTFRKQITGSVAPGRCRRVWIESPRGAVIARLSGTRFAAEVILAEGDNLLVARCAGADGARHTSAAQRWRVRLEARPLARIRMATTGDALRLDAGASAPAEPAPAALVRHEWRAGPFNPAPLLLRSGERLVGTVSGPVLELASPASDGDYRVDLRIVDARGRSERSAVLFRVERGQIRLVDPPVHRAAWLARAVVYGVVPFFFTPSGFAGVNARLDALQELGVDVLWLSPINAAAAGDFGYAVTDHFALRRDFGSPEELHALIAAAHHRGMRVIMDFVPNHTSAEHPYFAAAGPAEPYRDFYERDAAGAVAHYFDWEHLPNLDYDNPEVRNYVTAAFAHWVREYDIDGFRVDVAWGVRQRAPDFWPALRQELGRQRPDLLLLAEASARDPYYLRSGFDAAYDWTDELGVWAWRDAFARREQTAGALRTALRENRDGPDRVFRFLDNNDTGPRFVTRHGPALTRVALAMLLTLPGLPGLYTGQEVAAEYEPYDEGPPVVWQDRGGFTPLLRQLIALRRGQPALHAPGFTLLVSHPGDQVLAYLRHGARSEEDVLAVFHFGGRPVNAVIELDPRTPLARGRLRDLLDGGAAVRADRRGRLRLALAAPAAQLLVRAGDQVSSEHR
jgi:glycosidase